jgi:SOS response regulatory protein OraA/RecX
LRTAGGTADFYMHRARVRPASARRAGAVLSRALVRYLSAREHSRAELVRVMPHATRLRNWSVLDD